MPVEDLGTAERPVAPYADCVLVEVVRDRGTVSPTSPIIMPDTRHKRPNKARVLAVGPGRFIGGARIAMRVQVGDLVVLDAYRFEVVLAHGQLANAENTPYAGIGERAIIRERNIHAILERPSGTKTT